jgi:hypothetical protein
MRRRAAGAEQEPGLPALRPRGRDAAQDVLRAGARLLLFRRVRHCTSVRLSVLPPLDVATPAYQAFLCDRGCASTADLASLFFLALNFASAAFGRPRSPCATRSSLRRRSPLCARYRSSCIAVKSSLCAVALPVGCNASASELTMCSARSSFPVDAGRAMHANSFACAALSFQQSDALLEVTNALSQELKIG